MKKFVVETYYTCTFKTVHKLNNLNDKELSDIDKRNDGEVEVIDVKLNNRKTKKIGENKNKVNKDISIKNHVENNLSNKIVNKTDVKIKDFTGIKLKNNSRFKMPDRRKGYIQKAQIGDHKVYLHTGEVR